MNEDTSLNPICLLSRTDTQTFSLFHSFFLVSISFDENSRNDSKIIFRVPSKRDRLDDVETAVKFFSVNISGNNEDMYGSFVITTSDGSRFYALWRGSPSLLFIAISIFPLVAFTRNLFSLLINEHSSTLSPILQSLCEFPILACPSLRYNIRLSSGSLPLNFNEIGLVDDHDINTVAVRVLSPQMLVDAWEALILENQVLVLCSNPAIVPYCCEFLRRLILPLILINTFVPFLPEELLSTIEAPFPYLVGAQSDEVYNNRIDLSNTFVVDIDSQCVRPPRTYTEDCSAPINMKNKAIQEINALCYQPLAQWICRATESNLDGKNSNINNNNDINNNNNNNNNNNTTNHKSILIQPYSPDSMKICADGIIKCFIQMNLSLFAARHCDVRAFYRRCERPLACEGSKSREPFHLPKYKGPDGRISSMGFSYRNGVACGCMQLLNERKDIDVLQFLPCWVEMDSVVFSVYEYADELPLIFFLKKDIVSVSPSPAEPEGHVFDIQIGSQISYRFAATDPDSRRVWIKEIEKASSQRLLNQLPSLSPTTPTSLSTSTLTQSQLQSQSQSFSPAPNTPTTPHSPYPLYQQYSHLSIQSELELNHENDENGGGSSHTDFDDESNVLSRFRSKVVQTQMVSFFKTRSEFPEYGNMLGEQDLTHEDITIGIPYTTPQEDILNSQRINSQDGAESSCGEEHDNNNGNNGNGNGNNNGNGNGHNSVKYKLISDTDTTICSEVVIHNIKNIWGLYISGELVSNKGPYDVSYRGNRDRSENKRKGVSIRKSNLNTESASWLIQSPVSQAASLTFLSKTPREYTNLSLLHKAAIDADSNDQKSSKESSGWSILRTFMSSNEGDTSVKRNEAREELNKAIKEELMLKCAAGELLQRVSATHRQCEADLRKLIVHMKMKSIADIVDVNSLLRNDNLPPAVVVVDIERVAALAQTDMSAESRKRLRELVQSKHHTWQSCIKSWGEVIGSLNTPVSPTDKSPRLRRKSMQNLLFSAHLQQVTSSLDTVEEFSNMIPSLSFSGQHPNHNDEEDVTITRQSVMEYMESNGTFFKSHTKKLYSSPETDSIRRHIKIEIESQLIKSSESSAEVYEKVLIPVLHALNGYVCGRISGQERTAVSAYATGALGDQVRIMRCLLHIFLSFIKDRDSNSDSSVVVRTQVSTDITDGGTLNDYLHSLSYSDGESRYILNSQQIGEFLQWAAGIGDIIGLQAVRFVTELIHRCLAKRMAQRSLEQTEKLPVQSFGDNVLNEFKREVTHGIYSRRRVSLSNMQPSFIWVDVSGDKKSDVLNEVVNCTMSAAKPCELSIQLLNSLREMLRTVSEAGDGTEERIPASRQVAGSHHLILNDHLRETLCASSAFRSFEIQTSQLQMVDLLSLDDQSRIVFFSNIFNVIVVHAIILKGYTGTGFYDKCNFMRMAKYNLSGQIFNLLEIEHTILRAQTSSPNSIVGPFIHVSERSPKSVFALKKPIPHISFTLFFACYSSPPLTTLWDPSSVHQELRRAASTYLLTHARVDSATKTLLLPEIFKWYWRDFGESKKAVLTTVLHLLGRDSWLTQEILKHIDQNKPKIAHIPFDWRFVLII